VALAPPSADARTDVLRLVLYFDIFQHPLRDAELVRLVDPARPERVHEAVARLAASGELEHRQSHLYRPGRKELIARRKERAANAERLWPLAKVAAATLTRLPFVRGVLVTGSLSKLSTAPGDDVDFMILTAPGRVWTLHSLLQVARRSWPRALRDLFGNNYMLAEDRPLIGDRNLFTAIELATAVPMAGPVACARLMEANDWVRTFVPGMDWCVERALAAPPLPASARRLEERLPVGLLDRAEPLARRAWGGFWSRKYAWLDASLRQERFKQGEEVAATLLNDYRDYVLGEARRRMEAAGLHEALELARGGQPVGEA